MAERVEWSVWKRSCWIVCTPRSGSTWLSCMLNLAAGLDERLFPEDSTCNDYFGEHYHPAGRMRLLSLNGEMPRVSKVHSHWIRGGEAPMPPAGAGVVLLTRDDTEAQARSSCSAAASGTHNTHDPDCLAEYRNAYATADAGSVARVRKWYASQGDVFRRVSKSYECMPITYEELDADPEGTVARIVDGMGLLDLWEYVPSTLLKLRPDAH